MRDHLDPRWLGDLQVTTGRADGQFGPVVVAESRWPELLEPRARWVLVPDLDDVTAADLDAVARARDDLQTDWTGRVDDMDSLEVDGRLVDVAHEVALRTDGLRAGEPVVLLLLAAVGLVTLAALARLFVSTHAQELALLWARGASPARWRGRPRWRPPPPRPSVARSVRSAAVGVVLIGPGRPVRRHRAPRGRRGPRGGRVGGRPHRRAGPPPTTRVPRLAWAERSRRTAGGPWAGGARGRRGGARGVAAPGVRLPGHRGARAGRPRSTRSPWRHPRRSCSSAVVLAALTLFPAVAALAERRSGGDDVTRVLAARHLSRRLVPVTAPVLVVAIAAATLVSGGDVHADVGVRVRHDPSAPRRRRRAGVHR